MKIAVRLASSLPDLAALGVRDAAELLCAGPPRVPLAELVERRPGRSVWRFALPGARAGELAQGGWARLVRYEPGGAPALWRLAAERLTEPRSSSRAAREWNLLCRLQAAGVATPELLAVGEQSGALAAPRSFLVVREPAGWMPLEDWLAAAHGAPERPRRRRAATALGLALGAAARAGVRLPELAPRDLWIAAEPGERAEPEACALDELALARRERAFLMPRRRLPGIALAGAPGGRLGRPLAPRELARWLERLAARSAVELSASERRRVHAAAWRSLCAAEREAGALRRRAARRA